MKVLNEIKKKVLTNEWVESTAKGRGGVGITLESLLNKERENFEIPDYKGVEIKAKCSKKDTYITLFSAVPDSYLFEIKRLVQKYGFPDREYPQFKVFRLEIYGNRKRRTRYNYFKLYVNRESKQVILQVYDKNLNIIDELTSWSFEMLQEKLERKLSKLAIVHADRKFEHNVIYFKYTDIKFYQLISFERFLSLIENGTIRLTFQIGVYKDEQRFGEIYDHGTAFSINENDISSLFEQIYVYD